MNFSKLSFEYQLFNCTPNSVNHCLGGDQCAVVHAAVSLWSVLLVRPSQGARVSKCSLDIRMHCSETQGKD